jgi:putative ABC transport system permease protein
MRNFLIDLRYGLRMLRKKPAFASVAILTLALGIGANTALFTIVNAVLLRPLPFRDPDRLVRLWSRNDGRNLPFFSVSGPDYLDWRAANRTFTVLAAYDRGVTVTLSGGPDPEHVIVGPATVELFDVFGVSASHGRTLAIGDDRPDLETPVVVVSHGFANRRFGAPAAAVGSILTLDRVPHTIVGVMPPGFSVPNNPVDMWTPLRLTPDESSRGRHLFRVLGRLRPGATVDEARADMMLVSADLQARYPATNGGWSVSIVPLLDTVVADDFRQSLAVLAGAVVLVLLITCANVAGLLVTRAVDRQREVAIRNAIGASRWRLLQQFLAESLLLAGFGGGLGLVMAIWAIELLEWAQPPGIPRIDEIAVDGRVLAFTGLVTLATAVGFGLLPALRNSVARLGDVARQGGTRVRSARGQRATAGALVVLEFGVAVVVLAGAGLLIQSLRHVQGKDLGFDASGVLALQITLSEASHPTPSAVIGLHRALRERLEALPGVESVGAVSSEPFSGRNSGNTFGRESRMPPSSEVAPDTDYRVVDPGYFRTLGIGLAGGRSISDQDTDTAPVVVISETAARLFWPGENPIGQRIRFGPLDRGPWIQVVGIARDVRYADIDSPGGLRPMMYFAAAARPERTMTIVIRTSLDPASLAGPVRSAVRSQDPQLPLGRIVTMREVVSGALAARRFATAVFSLFAGLALVLAGVGIYGLVSDSVADRAAEFGLRMALGATPEQVFRMVLREGLARATLGVTFGLAAALAATRVIASLLFEVEATDLPTFAAVASLLVIVALAASGLPARQVTRLDPMSALRSE